MHLMILMHISRFILRYLITDELDIGRDRSLSVIDANERANKLSQRMRDLYDFKTENEWPKRAGNSQRENTWISISSSEEEKGNYRPIRRNSQDLEFNDRIDIFKVNKLKTMYIVRSQYTSCFCFVLFLDQGSARGRAKTKVKTHYPWRQRGVYEWTRGRASTKVQRQAAIQRGSRHGTDSWPRAAHILGWLRRKGSTCIPTTRIADDQTRTIRSTSNQETVSEQG